MRPVLIAGAGPVGLTLACELARYGVPVRIVDKAAQRTDKSKALVLWARTLELLDRGIGTAPFVAAGFEVHAVNIVSDGRRIARLTMDGVPSPYAFALMLPQSETERLLEERLQALGHAVEREVELLSFTQAEAGVAALLRHADGHEETLDASWLVGCDGAHSLVRHALGAEFAGETLDSDWILADLHLRGYPSPDSEITVHWHRDGVLVVFPIAPGRYRVVADLPPSGAAHPAAPGLAEVQAVIDRRGGPGMVAFDPVWLASFRINDRKVADYRHGRVFLAGDAAHIHSPAGGQGMNTGIQDAANLAWKLALVLRGEAPESLLDSYNDERWPVGQALLRTTDRMFSVGTTRNRLLIGARNLLVPLAGKVMQSRTLRQRMFRFVGQLGIAYPTSRIVDERLDGADRRFRQAPGKGERAPAVLHGGEALRTRLRGPKHHLLVFTGRQRGLELEALQRQVQDALGVHRRLCEVILIWRGDGVGPKGSIYDDRGLLHERYGLDGPGLYLLRPDGYIAFRAPRLDTAALQSYLQRVFAAS